ncbi:MAG: hypothetical protein ACTSRW_03285 [Candidatus Helarchaeota archaeon]
MKFNTDYIPIIILALFVLAMLGECMQLVQATGNIIFLLIIVIPIPVFVITGYVAIIRLRKKNKEDTK